MLYKHYILFLFIAISSCECDNRKNRKPFVDPCSSPIEIEEGRRSIYFKESRVGNCQATGESGQKIVIENLKESIFIIDYSLLKSDMSTPGSPPEIVKKEKNIKVGPLESHFVFCEIVEPNYEYDLKVDKFKVCQ